MCGITKVEDAMVGIDAGIDALGFIFAPQSARYLSPQNASTIIADLPSFITKVGVFVDSSFDEIKFIVQQSGINQVQLHGSETPGLCLRLKRWSKSLSICKAFRVGPGCPSIDLTQYNEVVNSILLDTYARGIPGGTGRSFDWRLVASLKPVRPFILAGGLNLENIVEALRQAAPFAVDINSGVESAPGIKDHNKINKIIARVRDFDNRGVR